jgi:hypothetical protein
MRSLLRTVGWRSIVRFGGKLKVESREVACHPGGGTDVDYIVALVGRFS